MRGSPLFRSLILVGTLLTTMVAVQPARGAGAQDPETYFGITANWNTIDGEWMNGEGWGANDTITVTIEETGVAPMEWVLPIEDGQPVVETAGPGILHSGQTVTVVGDDDGTTKVLDVPEILVTDIDLDADSVSGTTTAPGLGLKVYVSDDLNSFQLDRYVDADADGYWTAGFAPDLDLNRDDGIEGSVLQTDEDGDFAVNHWNIADRSGFWVTIDSMPAGIPDGVFGWAFAGVTEIQVVDPTPGGDSATWVQAANYFGSLDLYLDGEWDLKPGQVVTVTDAIGEPKTLVIPDVAISSGDVAQNTVRGTCDPTLDTVDVWVDHEPFVPLIGIACEDAGRFTADFTGAHNLVIGDRLGVQQTDADLDQGVYWWTAGYQPDALIRVGGTTGYTGGNVYDLNGSLQTRTADVTKSSKKVFLLKFQNDGSGTDSFAIDGDGRRGSFTIRYLAGTKGSKVITAQVVDGSYVIENLPPGRSKVIRLEVTVPSGATIATSKTWRITTTSEADEGKRDAVKAAVTVVTGSRLAGA